MKHLKMTNVSVCPSTSILQNIIAEQQTEENPLQTTSINPAGTIVKLKTKILVITTYPPRECGIATYSQDLIKAINLKFNQSLTVKVCALEAGDSHSAYPTEVSYILDSSDASDYQRVVKLINADSELMLVLIQHEFGLFALAEDAFSNFMSLLTLPIIVAFHTILPHPDEILKKRIQNISRKCPALIVMTQTSAAILENDYQIPSDKIEVIAHGTHLVAHQGKNILKKKYNLNGKKVLTTFGLLNSGKGIETTIYALPEILQHYPDVIFLIIGTTHPQVLKTEGEQYRNEIKTLIQKLHLEKNVRFINQYLDLETLLEYLQLTDVYLFTSKDPNQAVSGTFVYAMSCACPIISTPIPHARELLTKDTGILFDFENHVQLSKAVIELISNKMKRNKISNNALQKVVSTAWENSALAHVRLIEKVCGKHVTIRYNLPELSLNHLVRISNNFGIIQFARLNQPDINTGYTLDDNSRALIVMCMYHKNQQHPDNLHRITTYLNFIRFCLQPNNELLNYVNSKRTFSQQNYSENLDDSHGRAIWALGYVIAQNNQLPPEIISEAEELLSKLYEKAESIHSTRAMAFMVKGLYLANTGRQDESRKKLLITLSHRLLQMYRHESGNNWNWFESYMAYANSILPEAMLYAWLTTNESAYKEVAITSFRFLLSQTFGNTGIEVISNRKWLKKGEKKEPYGEQPIDVAYTILTLDRFFEVLKYEEYKLKIDIAFSWFLGTNRLQQIMYNPCTGGCYDGMEETHVNLNQGAESTLSYLMARLTIEKYAIKP